MTTFVATPPSEYIYLRNSQLSLEYPKSTHNKCKWELIISANLCLKSNINTHSLQEVLFSEAAESFIKLFHRWQHGVLHQTIT